MSDKTEIVNPIAEQAKLAAAQALVTKAEDKVAEIMPKLIPTLKLYFPDALAEFREPTDEEIANAVAFKGEDTVAFSNDNDGASWYINERVVPLVKQLAIANNKDEQVDVLFALLYEQEHYKLLPTTEKKKKMADLF